MLPGDSENPENHKMAIAGGCTFLMEFHAKTQGFTALLRISNKSGLSNFWSLVTQKSGEIMRNSPFFIVLKLLTENFIYV